MMNASRVLILASFQFYKGATLDLGVVMIYARLKHLYASECLGGDHHEQTD